MIEPSACLATRPVSTINSLSPSLIDSFRYFFTGILFSPSDNSTGNVYSVPQASNPPRVLGKISCYVLCEPRQREAGISEQQSKSGTRLHYREAHAASDAIR